MTRPEARCPLRFPTVRVLAAIGVAILAGCGGDAPPETPLVPAGAEEVARLEQEISHLRREHQADLAAQAARLERSFLEQTVEEQKELQQRVVRAEDAREILESVLAERDRELATLRETVRNPEPVAVAEVPTPSPEESSTARVSVFRPPPIPADRRSGSPGFPLRIYDLAGRRTVSGKHTNIRFVTAPETTGGGGRDASGKVRIAEPYEVDEYTYEVAFSVENLTPRAQTFSMRAGGVSRTVYLDAGETRTNVSVAAMMGAPLIITKDTHRRRFVVPASEPGDPE